MPVDRDFSGADAEEAAEIDDGCAQNPGAVDHHVNDPPQILPFRAFHRLAEQRLRRAPVDHNRRRFRRVLRFGLCAFGAGRGLLRRRF